MPSLEERVEFLISKVDNGRCADCFDKQPANVVILVGGIAKPMGAFICFRCARIHQKFGNELGYVLNARNEDDWSEEEVQALERGGNKIVNAIFESKIAFDHPRPDLNSTNDVREQFCTDKYVKRLFYSESKASKFLKSGNKQTSGRFALKAAAKDTGSSRGGLGALDSVKDLNRSTSTRGFNSSDSSGDFGFSDEDFAEEAAPQAAMNQLSLDQADPARPRPRTRARRRGSVGGDPRVAPRRTMSLQVDSGGAPNVRRSRPGRRASLGRTTSMGGAPVGEEGTSRMRRPGRRGSISTSNVGSSDNLNKSGSSDSLRESGAAGSRRGPRKTGALGNMLNSSQGENKEGGDGKSVASRDRNKRGNDPLGGSSHHGPAPGGRRRPQRRGSIGVEDANAKLNEKREMVW